MDTVSYMLGKRAGGGTMVETDPIFSSSPASGITTSDIENWNDKPDLTDYVKNDDYATSSKGGVLKTTSAYNFYLNNNGVPYAPTSTYESYLEKQSTTFIGKGTLENVIAGKGLQIQLSTMPTASVDYLDKIVQFTGTTDSTYTNGYFYKCVSDGQDPATYSWEEVEVQAGGGGASYTAGTNISIDSNNAINCSIPFTNDIASNRMNMLLGNNSFIKQKSIVIGNNINNRYYNDAICIGHGGSNTKNFQAMFGGYDCKINEIAMYTSNGIKVMATEEFVTNYLTTLTDYDSTKTQVLKNVNGTLTWVDE